MTDKALRLSRPQIRVLLEGFNHKIRRGGMNWFYHDGVNWSNPARFYNLATVRSLHKRGLLDANFDDSHLHYGYWKGVEDLTESRDFCSHERPMVWTSPYGSEFLNKNGFLRVSFASVRSPELKSRGKVDVCRVAQRRSAELCQRRRVKALAYCLAAMERLPSYQRELSDQKDIQTLFDTVRIPDSDREQLRKEAMEKFPLIADRSMIAAKKGCAGVRYRPRDQTIRKNPPNALRTPQIVSYRF